MGRRVALTFSLAVALLCAAVPATAAPLKFSEPVYIDDTFPGGEPVMLVDTIHHTIVYSTHEGTTHIYKQGIGVDTLPWFSEYRNQVKIWTSKDGGASFQRVDFSGSGFATNPTQNSGFSDPDLTIDAGGRIYNTGINLASDALFSSADGGFTWDRGTIQCHEGDRPWLAGGNKDEAWLATNSLAMDHIVLHTTDGGSNCDQESIDSPGGNGKIYFDHATQQLFEPAQREGKFGLNVIKRGDTQATFNPSPFASDYYAHWPAVVQDGGGTIWMVWDTDPDQEGTSGGCNGGATPAANEIVLAYTKDFGKSWSAPITVARPTNQRVLWPWVYAGDAGKVSVVWYQTDRIVDLACQSAALTIYAANVINGTDDAKRKVEVVNASGRPISINSICQSGTTCVATGEDRRLGDFFTNAIDERGCAIIASGDTMKPQTGSDSAPRATALPIFIRQISGPKLIGEGDCSGVPDPPAAAPGPVVTPPAAGCVKRQGFRVKVKAPKGQRLARATIYVNGKRVKTVRGSALRKAVKVRAPKGRFTVKVVATTSQGRRITTTKRYRACA